MQVPECILQPQSLLQRQQAMLKASLTGAWLTPNEVLIIGHTIPVPPQGKPWDPVFDLGGQKGRAGLEHFVPEPMQLEPNSPATDQVSSRINATPMEVSATVIAPSHAPYLHLFQNQHRH